MWAQLWRQEAHRGLACGKHNFRVPDKTWFLQLYCSLIYGSKGTGYKWRHPWDSVMDKKPKVFFLVFKLLLFCPRNIVAACSLTTLSYTHRSVLLSAISRETCSWSQRELTWRPTSGHYAERDRLWNTLT